jgi:hypothetical protein
MMSSCVYWPLCSTGSSLASQILICVCDSVCDSPDDGPSGQNM